MQSNRIKPFRTVYTAEDYRRDTIKRKKIRLDVAFWSDPSLAQTRTGILTFPGGDSDITRAIPHGLFERDPAVPIRKS